MTATETSSLREKVNTLFEAIITKDMEGAMALFAEDARLFDPHYPRQDMHGKVQIRDGLTWGFKSMKTFGFVVEKFYPGEDGQSAAVEVDSRHVLSTGKKLVFPQAFFFEFKDGLITRRAASSASSWVPTASSRKSGDKFPHKSSLKSSAMCQDNKERQNQRNCHSEPQRGISGPLDNSPKEHSPRLICGLASRRAYPFSPA